MPNYIRYYQEFSPYFVTTNTFNNIPVFKIDKHCQILLNNIDYYRAEMGFRFLGYVIIPWHLHAIFVPKGKYTISDIMRNIKYRTGERWRQNKSWEDLARSFFR